MSSPVLVKSNDGRIVTPIGILVADSITTITTIFMAGLRLLAPSTFGQIQFTTGGVLIDGSVRMNPTEAMCSTIGLGAAKKAFVAPQYNADVLSAGNYRGQTRTGSQGYAGSGTAIDSNWDALPFDTTTDVLAIPAEGFYEVCYHAVVGIPTPGPDLDKPAMFLFVNEQCVSMDLSDLTANPYVGNDTSNKTTCKLIRVGRTVSLYLQRGDEIKTNVMCNNPGGRQVSLDEYHVYALRTWMENTQPTFE